MTDRVDKYAKIMIAKWEDVEGKPVNASYIATFADMARAVVTEVDREIDAARSALYTEAYNAGIRDGFAQGHSDYDGGSYYG